MRSIDPWHVGGTPVDKRSASADDRGVREREALSVTMGPCGDRGDLRHPRPPDALGLDEAAAAPNAYPVRLPGRHAPLRVIA